VLLFVILNSEIKGEFYADMFVVTSFVINAVTYRM